LERGIPLMVFSKKIAKGAGLEERARDWRRECYALAAREAKARFVFLAQHARDQAETLLRNLMRGAGPKGGLGMLALAPLEGSPARLARPWLGVEPEGLRAELKRRRIRWQEDATNADTRFARNALRHKVLPLLEALHPGAVMNLAAFTRRKGAGLQGMDARALARVRSLLKAGRGSVDLKGGMALEASAGSLRLKPRVTMQMKAVGKEWRPEANAFWFGGVKGASDFRLRGAKAGDRMRPFGMSGSRLVFDLLAEAKVPAWKREGWPLLVAKGGGIAGVLGVRQAEGWRVGPATKRALRVSWPSFDRV
jgi:tRNA(Ile)-lysidine synthetase-like protein